MVDEHITSLIIPFHSRDGLKRFGKIFKPKANQCPSEVDAVREISDFEDYRLCGGRTNPQKAAYKYAKCIFHSTKSNSDAPNLTGDV